MLRFVAIVLLAVSGMAYVLPDTNSVVGKCWSSGNGQGPRYWSEGEQIDRGTFIFKCSAGQLVPYACKCDNGETLLADQSTINDDVQITCVRVGDSLEKKITGCAQNGQTYQEGQNFEDASTGQLFTCKRASNGYYMRTELIGCFYNGESLKFGDRRNNAKCVVECIHDSTGQAKMVTAGCVGSNGQTYLAGESYEEPSGAFTEYCGKSKYGDTCEIQTIGCVHNGKKLTDGDRYFLGEMIFQCQIRPDSRKHIVTGCVQRDEYGNTIERSINCRWFDFEGSHQYELCCIKEEGEEVKIRPEACVYMRDGIEALYLLPDTYTIYHGDNGEKTGVKCESQSDGKLRVQEFQPDSIPGGLQYDVPRGKK